MMEMMIGFGDQNATALRAARTTAVTDIRRVIPVN